MPHTSDTIYRFTHFAVDADARLLVRHGVPQTLQEQPFQMLLALLEHPGEVVTREDLRLHLWGTHTFVDFDQSLNSAVRRLRLALHDNPREPVYIATVPRIGFVFLPPVAVDFGVSEMHRTLATHASNAHALAT